MVRREKVFIWSSLSLKKDLQFFGKVLSKQIAYTKFSNRYGKDIIPKRLIENNAQGNKSLRFS